jgi:hypothetical protein
VSSSAPGEMCSTISLYTHAELLERLNDGRRPVDLDIPCSVGGTESSSRVSGRVGAVLGELRYRVSDDRVQEQ